MHYACPFIIISLAGVKSLLHCDAYHALTISHTQTEKD
jgi:hypothetical protein